LRVPGAIAPFPACFAWNASLHIRSGMPLLLHDRYLAIDGHHACDLVTGDVVATASLTGQPSVHDPSFPALVELLDHGRDGQPRSIVVNVRSTAALRASANRIGGAAADRGYVPIGVDVYARLRAAMPAEIAGRTLVLISSSRNERAGRSAFVDAATRTSKPHVLITLRCTPALASFQVREARAAYSSGATRTRIVPAVSSDVLQQLQRARRAADFVAEGRHAAAERLLRDVSAALARRSAWRPAVSILVQLGRLLLERGRPADAIRAFTDAIAAAGSVQDEALAAESRIWLATARTDAGELTAAESICRSLLVAGGLSGSLAAWADAALTRVLLWQNRAHEAAPLPIEVCSGEHALDDETVAFIRATRVRLLLGTGRRFKAGIAAGEAMAVVSGSPVARLMALTAHLRVLAAAGDLRGAEARLSEIREAARAARTPLRLLRARLIWVDALRHAGRTVEADRLLASLARVARAAPELLRHGVQRRLTPGRAPSGVTSGEAREGDDCAGNVSAAALVRLASEEDDDGRAVARLLAVAASRLGTTRIDLWSNDAGPPTIVDSAGTGLASTIGGRVLDCGLVIGPDHTDPPLQLGVPLRIGSRLIAALVARWPADRLPPGDALDVMELVAAVAAPRVDALLHRARTDAESATLIPELVGVSRVMAAVRQAVARAALAPFSVLVEGESGVGKELIARAVHYLSPRRERRFCDVNCAALPDDLIESELFGHAKGAFTGAVADRAGLFEEAHGGTLFLDEIADLSLRAQAKLLRVLQQQEIRRVGETFTRPVDVRLVAAANRDMRAESASGRFRQDLLYRVDVIRIDVPALRDRPEDIPALAQHFWRAAADRVGTMAVLSPATLSALAAYHWPGNVRELQNVVAALAVAASRRGRVNADLLPAAISGAMPVRTTKLAEARLQFERRFVEAALARAGGNRARAARALGLSRQGLLKLIERLKVTP
jgi:DNA-binding NtrC family response regulator